MIIPWEMLEPDTLTNLIEEFVSRDGTDNGYDETLNNKVKRVKSALKSGDMVIVFDQESETANLISRDQAHQSELLKKSQ